MTYFKGFLKLQNYVLMKDRKTLIVEMRRKRMTYRRIGDLLGISYQRVQQIDTGYVSPKRRQPPKHLPPIQLGSLPSVAHGQIAKLTGMKAGSRDRIRELIRIRDKHTCQICLAKWKKGKRRFDVHHMTEEYESGSNRGIPVAEMDRTQIDQMITLCHKCHLNLDSVRRKMSGGQQERWTERRTSVAQ